MELKIASYNVQNLFLCAEGGVDHPKPMKQLRPLARMIDQVAADILVLQEVGSQGSLDRLQERLTPAYPHAWVVPGNSLRSIHLAVLSRVPVRLTSLGDGFLVDAEGTQLRGFLTWEDAGQHRLQPVPIQRDILLCEVSLGERTLALFCVHLKSRTNPPWQVLAADDVRQAECRRLVECVTEYVAAHPHHDWMIIGDLNDTAGSAALAPLDDLGAVDCHADELQQSRTRQNPSTYWPKRGMRIDRILLRPDTARRLKQGSTCIHSSNMARTASDHYPVSLVLNF